METINPKTAALSTAMLTISDMSCASCVLHIEGDLKKKDGVLDAKVNFAMNSAQVSYDPDKLSPQDIADTIKKTGYTAEIMSDDNSQHNMGGKGMDHENMKHDGMNHEEMKHDGMDHSEHAQMEDHKKILIRRNRFLLSLILSVPILLFTFVIKFESAPYLMMILAFTILISPGKEFFQRGVPSLFKARPGMDTLVALGVGAAFLYSSYSILFTEASTEYFMDVAIIATFILLGRYLEAVAKGRASEAIKKLLELSAKIAHKITEKGTDDIAVDEVQVGDFLLVKPGEKIPVDGVLFEGEAVIDESMVTGESIPVDKAVGMSLIGATINGNTAFKMEAKKVGKETVLAQIVKLVQEAQMSKAPIQKLVDVVANYFVWGVLAIAIITVLAWYFATGDVPRAFIYTVSVLIIACPCALGLATPISIVVGSGKGAKMGILLKNAESLEKMHKITVICFDKTGTITKGQPEVQSFKSVSGDERNNLALALALEEASEHPLARSIVGYVKRKKDIEKLEVMNAKAVTGKGMQGKFRDKVYFLGSLKYMSELSVDLSNVIKSVESLQSSGHTVLMLSDGKEILAYFAVQDGIKETSKHAIELLKKRKIRTVMITGDNQRVAEKIAKEVGIDEVHASVSPEDKVRIVSDLQSKGEIVAMVGDGINDSPALAKSDVGIAMGTGTDIAMESGDVVLVKGDLLKAVEAIELSEATLRNIKQNLFWAFVYNTVGIPIAALGFLNPMISAAAMAFSSISVVLNALRLKRFKV